MPCWVSIPNGKPILFRLRAASSIRPDRSLVSIPNGKPILFRLTTVMWQRGQDNVFQSQTGSPSSSDLSRGVCRCAGGQVSIPNGKPILFRHKSPRSDHQSSSQVSIPNGKPILFRRISDLIGLVTGVQFQSQTGSPSSSDSMKFRRETASNFRFNPKREAHPLQTHGRLHGDTRCPHVSIPNGKPILFRRCQ